MKKVKLSKAEKSKNHMALLQKEWLKKNKVTKCPDVFMDNPYKRMNTSYIEF